jgi:tyrosyl-DNA phosphodiesterase-1
MPTGVPSNGTSSALGTRDGGRQNAAPHIKTYIRYSKGKTIDWALLTSANVSKQAWGEATNTSPGEFRIASWETGVMVWPELLAEDGAAKMVGTFKTDMPTPGDLDCDIEGVGDGGNDMSMNTNPPLVGLRIPYSLPLQRYEPQEEPWVATAVYTEPDWMGNTWEAWRA